MLLALALTVALTAPGPDTLSSSPPPMAARLRVGTVNPQLMVPSAVSRPLPTLSSASLVASMNAAADPDGDEEQLVEYSDGYFKRLTIHKWASYLTLPLFVGQYVVGQKLIDGEGSGSLRSAHGALAGGVAALFAVNTVTGAMNFWEARKDPYGRNRRTLHSALMLLADVGFVATGALAKENEHGGTADNSTHRAVAIASMGTALFSYAIMLPWFGGGE